MDSRHPLSPSAVLTSGGGHGGCGNCLSIPITVFANHHIHIVTEMLVRDRVHVFLSVRPQATFLLVKARDQGPLIPPYGDGICASVARTGGLGR